MDYTIRPNHQCGEERNLKDIKKEKFQRREIEGIKFQKIVKDLDQTITHSGSFKNEAYALKKKLTIHKPFFTIIRKRSVRLRKKACKTMLEKQIHCSDWTTKRSVMT